MKAHITTKCKPCPFCGARANEIEAITGMPMIACSNYSGCGALVSFNNKDCDERGVSRWRISTGELDRRAKMAEYHVGCGAFGDIYAGTLSTPRKDGLQMWRNKSEVTSEAVKAVMGHFITEMERSDKTKLEKAWGVIGNKKLKVTFEIFASKEENDDPQMDT